MTRQNGLIMGDQIKIETFAFPRKSGYLFIQKTTFVSTGTTVYKNFP